MGFVFDTNIISTFIKIDKIDILVKIFGDELLTTTGIINDLKAADSKELKESIKTEIFEIIALSNSEVELTKRILEEKNLGYGERECIAVCLTRGHVLVTNDKQAKKFAEDKGIYTVDLEAILQALKEIISIEELALLIKNIETKDNIIIPNKNEILSK